MSRARRMLSTPLDLVFERGERHGKLTSFKSSIKSSLKSSLGSTTGKLKTHFRRKSRASPPIALLPDELLSDIFLRVYELELAVLEDKDKDDYCPHRASVFALKLGRVCRHWRAATLATPVFWTNICTVIRRWSGSEKERDRVAWVRALLGRSGALPLTIVIYTTEERSFQTHPVIELLCAHAERWQDAALRLPLDAFWHKDLMEVQGRLPMLERLCVALDNWRSDALFQRVPIFSDTPKLRVVQLLDGDFTMTRFEFPWDQLGEVLIRGPQLWWSSVLMEHLRVAQNLTSLRIEGPQEYSPSIHITLPCLTELIITSKVNRASLAAIFDSITVPALTSLTLHYLAIMMAPWPQSSIISMLRRSSCTLASLSVPDNLHPDVLVDLLQECCSLQHLSITEFVDPVIETPSSTWLAYLLNTPIADAILVPELESLHIEGTEVDYKLLLAMLVDRHSGSWARDGQTYTCRPLKSVHMFSTFEPDTTRGQIIDELRRDGLEFNLTIGPPWWIGMK